jgi:hypothetical protein
LGVAAVLAASLLVWFPRAKPYDQYSLTGESLAIQVTAREQRFMALAAPGGIYDYEARRLPDGRWETILSFRYSSTEPIPRGQIVFLDRDIAYFYHEFIFAMTTDGGRSWTVRGEPERSFDATLQWRFPRIEHVALAADGTGLMRVSPYSWHKFTYRQLSTNDFGRTWHPVGEQDHRP